MGELRRLEFFQGVLGTGGEFICDEGWVKQAVHVPTGKALDTVHASEDPWDTRLAPGTRVILQGKLADGVVKVRHVYVQEELR